MKLLLSLFVIGSLLAATNLGAQTAKPQSQALCTALSDQVLHCPKFGFTYRVRFGWVDRTAEMQQESQPERQGSADSGEKPGEKNADASSKDSETLLAVFERPPGAPGETINSAVVITAEPHENYHGVKTAADYFGAITELAQQRGFKVTNEPHEFSIGAKQLVRGDFSKERGKLTMCQTSLALIERGYIISFRFIGESEDEIDQLVANLSFAGSKPLSKSK